jgi:catechol 2,3-dioxygenase-like lactoylglutathione lyase family enzyme
MGAFVATGMAVSDLEKATAFYVDVLGLRKLQEVDLDHMTEHLLGSGKPGAPTLVLMQYKGRPKPPSDTEASKFVFYVRDAAATVQAAVDAGGRITREPAPYGDNLVGFVTDPDGHLLELIQVPTT